MDQRTVKLIAQIGLSAIAFLLIITMFGSCSPATRIARICKNHPEVCKEASVDTIRDTVTIRLPGIKVVDSSFVLKIHDTITIRTKYSVLKLVRTGTDTFTAKDSLRPRNEAAIVPVVIKKNYQIKKEEKNIPIIIGLFFLCLFFIYLNIRKVP